MSHQELKSWMNQMAAEKKADHYKYGSVQAIVFLL